MVEEHTLYHGTSWEVAQIIKREGFKPSVGGCLGAGTYVARADKASRFAATCSRHGGDAGAVVEVRITFARAKYVRYNDSTLQAEGFDACRAERTSASEHPEWCLKSPSQVVVKEIRKVHCGVDRPAFEGEALSLGGVRHLASRAELSEVYFSEQDAVVSFAADAHAPRSARLHVYFQTGTVCCAFEHPRQGPMHAVRRKVDSNALELLFREARASSSGSCSCHGPPTGAKRSASGACHCNDRAKKPRHDLPGTSTCLREAMAGREEDEVKATLQKLRNEVQEAEAVLKDYRLRREEEERSAAERRKKEEEEEARRMAAEAARIAFANAVAAEAARVAAVKAARDARGRGYEFLLAQSDHCDKCMDETVKVCV